LNRRNFLSAALAFSLAAILLLKSADLGEGIRRGLHLCSYSVIPALFPFMAFSLYICKSSAADFFAAFLRPVTKLLKIPAFCGGALFASLIGGYPAGAKCINDLVLSGRLDRRTAGRMLCFCVNAGPPFLISAVGISVFGNIKTGILLFAAQIISSAIIAVICSAFAKKNFSFEEKEYAPCKNGAALAVESVTSAAKSCFEMCAFIVLACGALELLQGGAVFFALSGIPVAKALFTGFFEVTAGAFACKNITGFGAVIAAGAICSFSGISVILQVASAVDESKIPLLPFIVSRFFHTGITAGLLWLFFAFYKESAAVFAIKGSTAEAVLSASAPAAVSLLCMASLFLLSAVPPQSKKEPLLSRLKQRFIKQ